MLWDKVPKTAKSTIQVVALGGCVYCVYFVACGLLFLMSFVYTVPMYRALSLGTFFALEFAMAEVVDISTLDRVPSRGGKRRYNWELWQDGRVWKIKKGVDFVCSLRSMRIAIGVRASYVGMGYRTATNKGDETVTFQFFEGTK